MLSHQRTQYDYLISVHLFECIDSVVEFVKSINVAFQKYFQCLIKIMILIGLLAGLLPLAR